MKKLFLLIVLLVGTFGAQAQYGPHSDQSLLTTTSLVVSNSLGVTNLLSTTALGSTLAGTGTNKWGVTFTNYSGTAVTVTNNASITNTIYTYENFNLLGEGWLWVPRPVASALTRAVMIKCKGVTGLSTNTLTFKFAPLPDGINESTQSADVWTVGFTNVGASVYTMVTNVPAAYDNFSKIRLISVVNSSVDINSGINLLKVSLIGWPPTVP